MLGWSLNADFAGSPAEAQEPSTRADNKGSLLLIGVGCFAGLLLLFL